MTNSRGIYNKCETRHSGYEISQIDELIEKSKILITLCKSKEPDFLPSDLRPLLTEYMGFRHFFRHTYGYTIKWEKRSHLFLGFSDFWLKMKNSIEKYSQM